jgi:chromosome segregation ATPase
MGQLAALTIDYDIYIKYATAARENIITDHGVFTTASQKRITAMTIELETHKIASEERISKITTDCDSKIAERETIELEYKRRIDSARNNGQFWKNAHENLQCKHVITKDALKALTAEHAALEEELEVIKKALATSEATLNAAEIATTVANEHLESSRNAHNITKRAHDSERNAHSTTKHQLQF